MWAQNLRWLSFHLSNTYFWNLDDSSHCWVQQRDACCISKINIVLRGTLSSILQCKSPVWPCKYAWKQPRLNHVPWARRNILWSSAYPFFKKWNFYIQKKRVWSLYYFIRSSLFTNDHINPWKPFISMWSWITEDTATAIVPFSNEYITVLR